MDDPYASHLPILREIGRLLPVKLVLELGAGSYSTNCFLDQEIFPHLKMLISHETDHGWWEALSATMTDLRGSLFYEPVSMKDAVRRSLRLNEYDLIFIDNGSTCEERVETIEAVVSRNPQSLIVIHDWDNLLYRQAAQREGYSYLDVSKYYPATGLCSLNPEVLDKLSKEAQW